MTPRRRRMLFVGLIVLGVASAATLALTAFRDNVLYFYSPSDVTAGKVPQGRTFRVGGMVDKGSVKRAAGSLQVKFVVTDFAHDVTVQYTGVLPDLFREGQGVIARGRLVDSDPTRPTFVADEVLAKHDEKYMPPEVADSLKKSHEAQRTRQPSST